jgi:SAM-dependent methyltransferase
MPIEKVTFNDEWYDNLISKSDEKCILLDKFKEIIGDSFSSCLEIGLGTTSHFADSLSESFDKYVIIEKEDIKIPLPKNVELINEDWERVKLKQKFDVIIASHVIYYFDDKKRAIQKFFDSLAPNGIALFVVNGKDADYGPLKTRFSELVNHKYTFTYDELKNLLDSKDFEEHSIPSKIKFDKPSDLFDTLKLSFDQYPEEYTALKGKMHKYFKNHFSTKKYLTISQKIFVVKNNPWEKLIRHEDYELTIDGIPIIVRDKVFTPDPKITYSTSQILNSLPDVENKTVLDIGCGTGIIGIHCLKNNAKKVVFADNDKNAIENTRSNLELNNFNENFELINSNLFEKISGKFDYIFANLPILDEVWGSEDKTENIALQFLTQCKHHIPEHGKVLFSWASFSDISHIRNCLNKLKYNYDIAKDEKLGFTWYLIEISF